jgi:hypothetical protein
VYHGRLSLQPRPVTGQADPLGVRATFAHLHHAQLLRTPADRSELEGLVIQSPRDELQGNQASGNVRLSGLDLDDLDRLHEFVFRSQTADESEGILSATVTLK